MNAAMSVTLDSSSMTRETLCRSCRSDALTDVFSLGSTPLANRLLRPEQAEQPEPRYPLDLALCPSCALLQITTTIAPEELFSDYLYFSSFSDTVVENARANVDAVLARKPLGPEDLVIEIASNDGYLLQHYRQRGIPVLGIEPAANIAAVARERGIETRNEFFGEEAAQRLVAQKRTASVVHAHNVLAHVADLNGFVAGIARILRPDGIVVVEVPYVVDLIDHCEFDTIYHEHLCYYSVTALHALFARHGLQVADVQHVPIHGGTLRLTLVHSRTAAVPPSTNRFLQSEREWGVSDAATYRHFGSRIDRLRAELVSTLDRLHADGKRIAAYGASAKGATLLNVFGIGRGLIEYVIDRSTAKQGLLTPGTHLPIVAPDVLGNDAPDYLLLLSWNHASEILRQQDDYRRRGGKFIVPVPQPAIV